MIALRQGRILSLNGAAARLIGTEGKVSRLQGKMLFMSSYDWPWQALTEGSASLSQSLGIAGSIKQDSGADP